MKFLRQNCWCPWQWNVHRTVPVPLFSVYITRIALCYLWNGAIGWVQFHRYKNQNSFFPPSLLAIRKHCTIASHKLMCWRVGRGSRLASSDATSVVLVTKIVCNTKYTSLLYQIPVQSQLMQYYWNITSMFRYKCAIFRENTVPVL